MKVAAIWLGALTIAVAAQHAQASEIQVDIAFSGGSGRVLEIDQTERRIEIEPSSHPGKGWECWWSIHVTGLQPGEMISLGVGPAPWATPSRAAVSDDGLHWRQSAIGVRKSKRIHFKIPAKKSELYVAWGPPFTVEDARRLVQRVSTHVDVAEFELCRTKMNRPVWALRIQGASAKEPKYGVWIQARQHAWEAGSSWVCQGLVEWLVSDSPEAQWLRNHARLIIVPVMDVDNVAIGAGGKNQKPHDHNRDWSDRPIWPSVAAAQKQILAWDAEKRFDVFLDLHNPDAGARSPFFFVAPKDVRTSVADRNLERFLATVKDRMTGSLAFRGSARESGAKYDAAWRRISKNWVTMNTSDHVVAVTLETAWNTPHSHSEGYQTVGRQLGEAVARYLQTAPREPSSQGSAPGK